MKTLRYDPKSIRSGLTLVTLLCWILPILIIVTMFAVLGAYYLSDLLTNCLFRRRKAAEALVVLRADTSEQMWAGVLDARAALPDTAVVVLCPQEDAFTPPGAGMRGVAFATPDTLAQVVQAQLTVQE